jgi:hypothetical protein
MILVFRKEMILQLTIIKALKVDNEINRNLHLKIIVGR